MWFDMTYVGELYIVKFTWQYLMPWKKHRQFHFMVSKCAFHLTSTSIMICLQLWSLKATMISCGKTIFQFFPFYTKFDIPWINFFQKTSHEASFEYFLMYPVNSRIKASPPAEKGKILISWDYCLLSLFTGIKHIFMNSLKLNIKAKIQKETGKGQFKRILSCLPRNMATCQTEPPSNTYTVQSDLQSNFFRASTCAQLMTCRTWNLLSSNHSLCFLLGNTLCLKKWNALARSLVSGNCLLHPSCTSLTLSFPITMLAYSPVPLFLSSSTLTTLLRATRWLQLNF